MRDGKKIDGEIQEAKLNGNFFHSAEEPDPP